MNRRPAMKCIGALVVLLSVPVLADGVSHAAPDYDFDGDGKADVSVVRDEGGSLRWWIADSTGSVSTDLFGLAASDFYVPADYDGDGKDDIAVWRGGASPAFYIKQSSDGVVRVEPFGLDGDDPTVVGDWDGDGKADPAVYREGAAAGAQSMFYYLGSLNNPAKLITVIPWGVQGDTPIAADYDGDAKFDAAVRRQSVPQAQNWILRSSDGGAEVVTFGLASDLVVPGDYDGDGKADFMAARVVGADIVWWLLTRTGAVSIVQWGLSASDVLIAGDYDGDGKSDVGIYRPGTGGGIQGRAWVRRSSDFGLFVASWGIQADAPVPGAYVR